MEGMAQDFLVKMGGNLCRGPIERAVSIAFH